MNVADALVITLGLDASAFIKAQKQATTSLDQLKSEATKSGTAIERVGKNITADLDKTTRGVFKLLGAFVGAKSIEGFIKTADGVNVSLGLLAASMASAPATIYAYGAAAERMGGSTAAIQATIQGLSDTLIDLNASGKDLPQAIQLLAADSNSKIDFAHGWQKLATDMATAASKLAKKDPALADRLLRQSGLDPASAQLFIQQGGHLLTYLQQNEKRAPAAKDLAAAGAMTDQYAQMNQAWDNAKTKLATALTPLLDALAKAITPILDKLSAWIDKNPELAAGLTAVAVALSVGGAIAITASLTSLGLALAGLAAANTLSVGAGLLGLLARFGIIGIAVGGAVVVGSALVNQSAGDGGGTDDVPGKPLGGNDAIRRRRTNSGSGPQDQAPAGGNTPAPSGPITPENHPVRYEGNLKVGDQTFHFASGGNHGAMSSPPGDHPIESYTPPGHRPGTIFNQGYFRTSDVYDPELKRMRSGVLIHESSSQSDIHKVVSSGCFAVPRSEWPQLETALSAKLKQLGGHAVLRVGGDGNAEVVPVGTPKGTLWHGDPALASYPKGQAGAAAAAARAVRPANVTNTNDQHVNRMIVHAPNATDAQGIAMHIDKALADSYFARMSGASQ